VKDAPWDPIAWKLPIPPRVADAMDGGQKWALACTREALLDYGAPERPLDRMRTAVILGNAMAGEKHYMTALRVFFPEYAKALGVAPSFASLPAQIREAIVGESRALFGDALPPITEDTMPGELSNCIAGRIANVFDLHGPNYTVDAACASAMAAMSAAIEGLMERDFDVAITGGIDRNMGPSSFVKFCKIGALSATGTRPYADGADGFVMGEGAGGVHPQAAGGRRAGRRQDLRGDPRDRRLQRRQGKGHHRAEPGGAEARRPARLGQRAPRSGDVLSRGGTRHLDARR
jgi:acyl transferase domain-containing protein